MRTAPHHPDRGGAAGAGFTLLELIIAVTLLAVFVLPMFEVLTGQRPFRGEDVVNQQLHVDMPDPRVIRADIPEELAGIIQRACEKRPRDRFQSPREMAAALSEFLSSSNVF